MDKNIKNFWYATWHVWRTGWGESEYSQTLKQVASIPFEKFLEMRVVKNPAIKELLVNNPTKENEFLIAYGPRKVPGFFLTNYRLWIYDKEKEKYICTDLLDIVDANVESGFWSSQISLKRKDQTVRTFPRGDAPKQEILQRAIEQRRAIVQEKTIETDGETHVPVSAPEQIEANRKEIVAEKDLPKERIAFTCRHCGSGLDWGQEECDQCNQSVVAGLPDWLDSLIGFVITGVLYLIVFVIVSLVTSSLDLDLALTIRLVISVLLVHWRIGLPTSLKVYPRVARLMLSYRENETDSFSKHEPVEFYVEQENWESKNYDPYKLETFTWGVRPEDEAILVGIFPRSIVEKRLLELSKHNDAKVRQAAIVSMSKMGGDIFVDRLKSMANNDVDADVKKAAKKFIGENSTSNEE